MNEFVWIDGIQGPKLGLGPDSLTIGNSYVSFRSIETVEIIDKSTLDKKASTNLGLVGLLIGGPLGGALGAGLGALTAPVVFVVTTRSGEKHVCNAGKLLFNGWHKRWKVYEASRR